jgi:hypothetical protein
MPARDVNIALDRLRRNDVRYGLALDKDRVARPPGWQAHEAFTLGVFDAVVEDRRLAVETITAASAGAMNARCDRGGQT